MWMASWRVARICWASGCSSTSDLPIVQTVSDFSKLIINGTAFLGNSYLFVPYKTKDTTVKNGYERTHNFFLKRA